MAASTNESSPNILGQFHPKCGEDVTLSKDRRTASARYGGLCIALSNDPIPIGLKFSVKVLQQSSISYLQGLIIGVTSKSPDSGPVPENWSDILNDQYWYVWIDSSACTACHKGQRRELQWKVDHSPGNTLGVAVSQTGELHLYHNGRDVGVAWEELPTDKPLWGFVCLPGGWKVETNYIIAKGHPQDYGGKTYHFVERPPERQVCAVCQALAHDPVQATCCGKIYCARCIERWKGRSNSCPTCRSTEQSDPPFNVFRDRNAHQWITSLAVYCPNQCDGCSKKMELSEVNNHLMSDGGCPLQVVDCGNKCGHKERRAGVKKHMTSECCLRREKCQYCPLVSTHEQVTGAHLKECPNFPLDCPNKCNAQGLTRRTVPAHRGVCPLQQVECEYRRFGCAVVLLRNEVEGHLKASVENHLHLTKKRVADMDKLEKRVEEQETQLREERAERQLLITKAQKMEARLQIAEKVEARLEELEATMARLVTRMK